MHKLISDIRFCKRTIQYKSDFYFITWSMHQLTGVG